MGKTKSKVKVIKNNYELFKTMHNPWTAKDNCPGCGKEYLADIDVEYPKPGDTSCSAYFLCTDCEKKDLVFSDDGGIDPGAWMRYFKLVFDLIPID